MEMESFFSRKEYINSKAPLWRTKPMEMAGLPFKMVTFLKAFSSTENAKEKAFTYIKMVRDLKENTSTIKESQVP